MKGIKLAWLAVVVAAALLAAGNVFAAGGIMASSHDMIDRYNKPDSDSKKGACSFCHIPHGAGAKLYGGAVDPATVPGDWAGDGIAAICYECHGLAGNEFAQNVTVFDSTRAHSNIVSSTRLGGETVNESNIHGISGGKITCTSCHDVHSNTVRPFLRAYAGTTPVVEGQLGTLCVQCHNTRAQNAGAGDFRNHPTGIEQLGVANHSNIIAKSAMTGRAPARLAAHFPNMTLEMSDADGEHWNLGGHYRTTAVDYAGGEAGTFFDCATCHAVHNNEVVDASTPATDGLNGNNVGTAIDPLGPELQPLSAAGGTTLGSVEPLCAACHANASPAGPGATGYSHPTWTYTSGTPAVWPSGVTSVTLSAGQEWATNSGQRGIVCQSCHDVHYARYFDAGVKYILTGFDCGDCHDSSQIANHHPSGITITDSDKDLDANMADTFIDTTYNWAQIGVLSASTRTAVQTESYPGTFRTAGSTKYKFAGADNNVMGCSTCHGAATVHNQPSAWVPTLVRGNLESQMCIDCHGTNPSNNTTTAGQGTSSTNALGTHFVGTITNTNYKWMQNVGASALVTPNSGADAKYGTSGSVGAIICESCHTLKFKSPIVLANTKSNNAGDGETSTRDNVGLLLTNSGNMQEFTDNTVNLCTACHGAAVSIGTKTGSHPIMTLGGWDVAARTYITALEGGDDNVSLTTNNRVNCESCHRPHDATSAGETRILEISGNAGGFLDEQGLCIACHGDKIPVN